MSTRKFCLSETYCLKNQALVRAHRSAKAAAAAQAHNWLGESKLARNAALYFPRIKARDHMGEIREYVPAGAIADVFARTDVQRSVWKAPAGRDAILSGVTVLTLTLTDATVS